MTSSGTYEVGPIEAHHKISPRMERGLTRPSLVYRATNLVNGKFYIGVTMGSLAKRKREHRHAARSGVRGRFYNAIRKYGEHNFVFAVIDETQDYKSALALEVRRISELKPQYNLSAGGEGNSGFKMPRHIVERIAEKRRGSVGYWRGKSRPDVARMNSERLKASPLTFWLGKKRSQETIEKIRATKTGKPRAKPTPEVLQIFADNMRRAAEARKRRVRCLDDGLVFDSAASAADHYGFKKLSINQVCSNPKKRKTLFGRRFEYVVTV